MKVYIASSDYLKAQGTINVLNDHLEREWQTHCFWVTLRPLDYQSGKVTTQEKTERCARNFQDIKACDLLILLDDYDSVPGGKWVDFGYALACGKPCYVLGRHENSYTYAEGVKVCKTLADLITELNQWTPKRSKK